MKTQQHLEVSIDRLQTGYLVSEIVTCSDFGLDWVFLCCVNNSDYRKKAFFLGYQSGCGNWASNIQAFSAGVRWNVQWSQKAASRWIAATTGRIH